MRIEAPLPAFGWGSKSDSSRCSAFVFALLFSSLHAVARSWKDHSLPLELYSVRNEKKINAQEEPGLRKAKVRRISVWLGEHLIQA